LEPRRADDRVRSPVVVDVPGVGHRLTVFVAGRRPQVGPEEAAVKKNDKSWDCKIINR
jgi:hypothetical protein